MHRTVQRMESPRMEDRWSSQISPETAGSPQRNGLSIWRDDSGSVTAEYAIATMAAVGFAGLLVIILKSDEVRGILTNLVRKALSVG